MDSDYPSGELVHCARAQSAQPLFYLFGSIFGAVITTTMALNPNDANMLSNLGTAQSLMKTVPVSLERLKETLCGKFLATVMYPEYDQTAARLARRKKTAGALQDTMLPSIRQFRRNGLRKLSHRDEDELTEATVDFAAHCVEHERLRLAKAMADAIDDMRADQKLTAAISGMDEVTECLTLLTQQLTVLTGTESSGRVAYAVSRESAVKAYNGNIGRLKLLYDEKANLEKAQKSLIEDEQKKLVAVKYQVSSIPDSDISSAESRRKMLESSLRNIERRIVPEGEAMGGKLQGQINIPANMDQMLRGQELAESMEAFLELNSGMFRVVRSVVKRMLNDIDPVTGLYWRPPTLSDGYADLPESLRERATMESNKLYTLMTSERQLTSAMIHDVERPFAIGIGGKTTGIVAHGDGVGLLWGLMSKYRPLNDTYKNDVENFLDNAYSLFQKYDGTIIKTVSRVQKRIDEAKLLGIRIKWHKTGERWLKLLERRNNFAVGLQKFNDHNGNTDDCVLRLEELVKEIEIIATAEFTSPDVNTPFGNQIGMLAQAQEMEQQTVLADGGYALANFSQGMPYMSIDHCTGEEQAMMGFARSPHMYEDDDSTGVCSGRRLMQAKASGGSYKGLGAQRGRTSSYRGSAGRGSGRGYMSRPGAYAANPEHLMMSEMRLPPKQWSSKNGCFGQGCCESKFKNYDFCSTCHRAGVSNGEIVAKDGKTYKLLRFSSSSEEERKAAQGAIIQGAMSYRKLSAQFMQAMNAESEPYNPYQEERQEMEQLSNEFGDGQQALGATCCMPVADVTGQKRIRDPSQDVAMSAMVGKEQKLHMWAAGDDDSVFGDKAGDTALLAQLNGVCTNLNKQRQQ